jgi:hypothetical protein
MRKLLLAAAAFNAVEGKRKAKSAAAKKPRRARARGVHVVASRRRLRKRLPS